MIIASIIFGMNPMLISRATERGIDPVSLVFLMYVVNCAVNAAVCRCRGIRLTEGITRGKAALLLLWGMVGMGWTGCLLTMSYRLIGTGTSTVLHFMYPAFVTVVMAMLFRERTDRRKVFALLLSVAGVALIAQVTGGGGFLMFAPALLSSVTYGSYLIANGSRIFGGIPLQAKCTWMAAGVWISFGLFLLATGRITWPSDPVHAGMVVLTGCTSATAYNALVYGIGKIGASKGAFATLLEPLTSMAVGILAGGEMLTARKAAGSIAVLLAVALSSGG